MAELPRGYRANRLAVLTGTHFVNDFYQGATSAIIALLALSNGYSYMAVTGLLLAVTASSSVVQPLLGFLADRFQTRWMMPAGIVTCGLGTGLLGIADGYWSTCAAAVVAGLGIAAYHPEAARAVRDTGGESATAMSWFALGGNVGFTLGPLAASPFLVWRGLDASPWLALPAFVTAVAGIWALRAHTAVRQQDRIRPAKQTGRDDWKAFGWLTISISARSAVIVGVASFVPLLFVRQFHVTPLIGSGALGLFFAAGLVGTLAGGRLADRRGATFPLWLGYTATGLGLLALALASDVWIAWAAVLVLGVGSYLPFGVNVTLGQRYLSNRTATASGVTLGLAVSVGGFVASVFGMIADRAGLTTTLLAMVLMPVIAFVATTRLPATTKSAG